MRTIPYEQIRKTFLWGRVRRIHRVGPYAIVECDDRRPDNAKDDWQPSVGFHPYVVLDGESGYLDTGHSYGSLDAALVACVVFTSECLTHDINTAMNERLTGYIMRALRG